jgi:hypothetical protein
MYTIKPIAGSSGAWSWDSNKKQLEFRDHKTNRPLGLIQMTSIQDEKSKEIYQQPWWLESRGEIDIIATPDERIVFVQVERHSVIPPELYEKDWGENPPDPFRYISGIIELELPRGFSGAIKIEAEEETMYQVEYVDTIGHVNGNTSFFATSPFIVVYKALPENSGKKADPSERILKVEPLKSEEIAHLETMCGFTRAALWEFCKWAFTKQDDSYWQRIAKGIFDTWVDFIKS